MMDDTNRVHKIKAAAVNKEAQYYWLKPPLQKDANRWTAVWMEAQTLIWAKREYLKIFAREFLSLLSYD